MAEVPPSLIETIRVMRSRVPLWPLHAARLRQSAAAVGLAVPGELRPPSGGEDRAVRLVLGPDGLAHTSRAVGASRPVHLVTSSVVHPGYRLKVTMRDAFEAARAEALRNGADDALLLTENGIVAEGSIWSLGWWRPRGLAFPALTLGVLPGVGRARLAALRPVEEEVVRPAALHGASLVLVNAVRGVVTVASLDGREVPADERTAALQAEFWPNDGTPATERGGGLESLIY